ncbi:hypothetical protein JCM8115_001879 [Rhodotorula mucilaginosa]|uniref:GH26 domain-containing protein n=1 Tax=Rhodotorula mucilaginosa TaxID=5537 RepID=A0A9P7B3X4_RHOMI|nr:hypothetical protein C6P46_006176 [Rhodotorula mucilaginosa]TKA50851.1 hypothetical protein B0A53_05927 [Rhodotorula sp. CCFEE 5036]
MFASTSTAAPSRPSRSPRRRSPLARAARTALALAVAGTAISAVNGAMYEPPEGQVMLGFWFDPANPYNDRPSIINEKLGNNVPVFQIAQPIPLPPYNWTTGVGGPAPENTIEQSGTDAAVFLTIYPTEGFAAVTDEDFIALGKQILDYQTTLNRTTFLRYAPEMQGTWMRYGQQPTAFLQSWQNMYTLVKSVAPETVIVWAPNTPQGYPYGQTGTAFTSLSSVDQALLDTNQNGVLDAGDDSLAPYYPGDDLVDWIGLSIYYKGIPSDTMNSIQPNNYCSDVITGTDPGTGNAITEWYQTYCANKPSKACMFAECGAAFHVNDAGVSAAALQQAWLTDCITSQNMLTRFPRIKLYNQFEYEKTETANDGSDDLRDYRVLNNTAVLDELKADLNSLSGSFYWAASRAPPTSISSAGAPAATNSAGSTVKQAITATTRPRPTTFPSLFGTTSDGTQRAEWAELGIMVAAGVVGAYSVMRTL